MFWKVFWSIFVFSCELAGHDRSMFFFESKTWWFLKSLATGSGNLQCLSKGHGCSIAWWDALGKELCIPGHPRVKTGVNKLRTIERLENLPVFQWKAASFGGIRNIQQHVNREPCPFVGPLQKRAAAAKKSDDGVGIWANWLMLQVWFESRNSMTFIIAIMKLSTRWFFPQVAGTAPTGGTFSASYICNSYYG